MRINNKKAVSFFMAVIMLLANFIFTADVFADSSVEPLGAITLKSVKSGYNLVRFKGGSFPDFLFDQIGYEKDGKTWPAYCIEPDKPGVSGSTSYDVEANTLGLSANFETIKQEINFNGDVIINLVIKMINNEQRIAKIDSRQYQQLFGVTKATFEKMLSAFGYVRQ